MSDVVKFLHPKIAQEKLMLTFDFSKGLAVDETLQGAVTVIVSVVRGKDNAPASMINGAAQLDATTKMVLQPIQGGMKGNEYSIRVVAPTTNPLKVLAMDALLEVV